jgi:hypothetical protein
MRRPCRFGLRTGLTTLSVAALVATGTAAAAGSVPDSPEKIEPLLIGSAAPEAKLRTMEGEAITLAEALGSKPAVVVFYRGGW